MWTVVIVLQVALTVVLIPLAVARGVQLGGTSRSVRADRAFASAMGSGFPADEIVTAQLGRDPTVPPRTPEERTEFLQRSRLLFEEVRDRIAADPAVDGVAFASGLSAMNHVVTPVEFTAEGSADPMGGIARILLVDRSYLDLMGATPVTGRALSPGDFNAESRSVVVNEAFVNAVLGGANPVGSQLQFPEREGEMSIVNIPASGSTVDVLGVVRNPEIDAFGPGIHPVIYAPLDLAPVTPREVGLVGMPQAPVVQPFVRMRPGTGPSIERLYSIVADVDPTLRLSEVGTAAATWAPVHAGERLGAWVFMAVGAIVLMLSVAGVYSLMSFTVSQRSREIAIRTAVGAQRGQILRGIFGRAALQLLAGVFLGALVAVPVLWNGFVEEGPRSLMVVSALLLGAGLVACLVPVRRALAIEPASAMKLD